MATGGGVVLRPENWGAMQHGVVVRLTASTELLAKRVVTQGKGTRPLLAGDVQHTDAMDEVEATRSRLDGILADREHLYANADVTVSVEGQAADPQGAPTAVVVYRCGSVGSRTKSNFALTFLHTGCSRRLSSGSKGRRRNGRRRKTLRLRGWRMRQTA